VIDGINSTTELSKGWLLIKLGQIADIGQGGTPSTSKKEYWSGKVPWLRSGAVRFNRIAQASECITELGLKNSPAKLLPKGTVLLAMTGQGLTRGRAAILDIEASANQSCAHFILDQNLVLSEFLFYYFRYEYWNIRSKDKGSNQPGLNTSIIKGFFFPLAPVAEQKRIVVKIEELFSLLDAGTESLRKVQAQLKRYRQAILKTAINGDLTKEWRISHSEILLSDSEYAKLIERQKINNKNEQLIKRTEKFFQDKSLLRKLPDGWLYVPLIEVATLHRGFDLPHNKRKIGSFPVVASSSIVGYHNEAKIKGPGVVTGRSGTIGEVRYIESDFWPLNTALYVCDFHGNEPKFVSILLQAMQIQKFLSGTGVPTLNRNNIHPVQVPLPQLPEQLEIVSKAEQLFSLIEQINTSITLALSQSDQLRQSILKDAFIGKLVPQEPKDEPAEKLLERKKAERLGKNKSNSHLELCCNVN
jgi:type I restriction enzyme S subunit